MTRLGRVAVALRSRCDWLREKRRYASSLQRYFVAAGVVYLLLLLAIGLRQVMTVSWRDYLRALLLGLTLYPLSLVALALAWAFLIGVSRSSRVAVRWRDVEVFLSSHLMKRLPGGIWYVAARVVAYREGDVGTSLAVGASAMEWAAVVLTAAVGYAFFGLPGLGDSVVRMGEAISGIALLGTLAGLLVVSRGDGTTGPTRAVAVLAAVAIGTLQFVALANGATIAYMLLRAGGGDLAPDRTMAAWSLAAAAGAMVAIIPFSAALRDITLAAILGSQVPVPLAVAVTALTRLLFIAGDAIWTIAILAVARWARRSHRIDVGADCEALPGPLQSPPGARK